MMTTLVLGDRLIVSHTPSSCSKSHDVLGRADLLALDFDLQFSFSFCKIHFGKTGSVDRINGGSCQIRRKIELTKSREKISYSHETFCTMMMDACEVCGSKVKTLTNIPTSEEIHLGFSFIDISDTVLNDDIVIAAQNHNYIEPLTRQIAEYEMGIKEHPVFRQAKSGGLQDLEKSTAVKELLESIEEMKDAVKKKGIVKFFSLVHHKALILRFRSTSNRNDGTKKGVEQVG